jgi:hypothetical protein
MPALAEVSIQATLDLGGCLRFTGGFSIAKSTSVATE